MNKQTKLLGFTVLFAAINYIVFTYLKINIPMPTGGSVAIHVANAVVVLSAWLIGPRYGALAGAIGLSLADVLDPLYVASAPKTFFLKFMIAYIAGTLAERMGLHETDDPARIRKTVKRILARLRALIFVMLTPHSVRTLGSTQRYAISVSRLTIT